MWNGVYSSCWFIILLVTIIKRRCTNTKWKGMKTGRRAWNKDTRKIGACLHPTRWSQRLDIAIAEVIATAVITWTASAIAIYTIRSCCPCMWTNSFMIFWHRHEMNRMNHHNNWHGHGHGHGTCSKSTRSRSRHIQTRGIWVQPSICICLLARWPAAQTAKKTWIYNQFIKYILNIIYLNSFEFIWIHLNSFD